MSDLCCIVYMSRATKHLETQELEVLLQKARVFNEQVGVTGVLLHHHDIFIQYLEGECGEGKGLAQVYKRIKQSGKHRILDELLHSPIDERLFANWSMGSSYVSKENMLSLENASWKNQVEALKRQQLTSQNFGLAMLVSVLGSIDDLVHQEL